MTEPRSNGIAISQVARAVVILAHRTTVAMVTSSEDQKERRNKGRMATTTEKDNKPAIASSEMEMMEMNQQPLNAVQSFSKRQSTTKLSLYQSLANISSTCRKAISSDASPVPTSKFLACFGY